MRGTVLVVIAAGLSALGTSVALGQATYRPAPMLIGQAIPRDTDLTAKISALQTQVAEDRKAIQQLQSALQTVSIKGYDTAGKLEQLRVAFVHHDHFYTFATQSGSTQTLQTTRVTAPAQYCKKARSGGLAIDQYECGNGY